MKRVAVGAWLGVLVLLAGCGATTTGEQAASGSSASTTSSSLPPGCHTAVATDVPTALTILTDPVGCPGAVNTFWHMRLGAKWTTPVHFIGYQDGQRPADACGQQTNDPSQFADNAFYCPEDDTIAYSENLLAELVQAGGPYLPVVVLEHEEGHRADRLGDHMGVVSRSEENQADCDAGATTRFARDAHRLPLTDVISAARLLYALGDKRAFGRERANTPGAHGTPAERLEAFVAGYDRGVSACLRIGQNPTGRVL